MTTPANVSSTNSTPFNTPPSTPIRPPSPKRDTQATPQMPPTTKNPPQEALSKELLVKIGGTEYVMTIYIDDKKVDITNDALANTIKDLANKLIADIEKPNSTIFKDKIIQNITNEGIFDTDKNLIHKFTESDNKTWLELKNVILTIQAQSLPKDGSVKVDLHPKDGAPKPNTDSVGDSDSDSETDSVGESESEDESDDDFDDYFL